MATQFGSSTPWAKAAAAATKASPATKGYVVPQGNYGGLKTITKLPVLKKIAAGGTKGTAAPATQKKAAQQLSSIQSGAGGTGGGVATPAPSGTSTTSTGKIVPSAIQPEDTELYKSMVEGDFLNWQKNRADEMLRLRNLETELFGDGGKVGQAETSDLQERRRLAAQMAAAGTLQGGAYIGGERGLDTLARVQQTNEMQDLLRPFMEQTDTGRLSEYGIEYDPRAAAIRQATEGAPNARDIYGGTFTQGDNFSTTYAGRIAAQQARAAALQQLLSRMTTV